MHGDGGSGAGNDTGGGRTQRPSTSAEADMHAAEHVQAAREKSRTLQKSREDWGVWLLTTLRSLGVSTQTYADGWLGVSESIVRRLFSAEKPLTVGHIECGPDEVAEAFVRDLVIAKWGRSRGLVVLARVMAEVATTKETAK